MSDLSFDINQDGIYAVIFYPTIPINTIKWSFDKGLIAKNGKLIF